MTAVDRFLGELEAALHVRGRVRRRLVAECRDHLCESGAVCGPEEAVRRFGTATDLARAYEKEVAARRTIRATAVTVAGVLAVGASVLMMVHAADPRASAPLVWAVVFFGAAQTSAAALVLAVLRAAAMRGEVSTPADVALLCRRNATALGFALLTMFAVGAALPGHTAAWKVLAGPVMALVAAASVAHARSLAHQMEPRPGRIVRAPWVDAALLANRFVPVPGFVWRLPAAAVLVPTVLAAMVAAFAWDLLDYGTVAGSGGAAGVEAALTIAGFMLLGHSLGLRPALSRRG